MKAGGRLEKDDRGRESLVIPVDEQKLDALEECWNPAPPRASRLTDEEIARIKDPR